MPHNGGSPIMVGDEELDVEDERTFTDRLYRFMIERGSPIEKIPIFDHKELDLYQLYKGVITRGGLETVIENKLWRQITNELSVDPERTDAGFRLRIHYLKYLYPYERKFFLGLDDDEFDYEAYEKQISKSTHTSTGSRERTVRSLPARRKRMAQSHAGLAYSHLSGNRETPNIHCDSPNSLGISDRPPLPSTERQPLTRYHPMPASLAPNFKQLDVMTLKRYKKYHRLKVVGAPSKKDLAELVARHFVSQKVEEDSVINAFVAHVRSSKELQREKEQRRRNASRKIIPIYDERNC